MRPGFPGWKDGGSAPRALVAASAALILVAFAAAVLVSVWLSARAISGSDHRWCSVVGLLIAKPVPPTAANVRSGTYTLYLDLVQLHREFGCNQG